RGPAWANSLFEDNAEFGYGMLMAVKQMREKIERNMRALLELDVDEKLKEALEEWLEYKDDRKETRAKSEKVVEAINSVDTTDSVVRSLCDRILEAKDYLVKKSVWTLGGDGWAYDIGYGGLDHILASGENINILVFDTEVYSNTGGQASKATPTAAIAKFAASGKRIKKKDLGLMAMSYGYVYVAQVGMGADKNQLMKAMLEAEAYDGPSLIIAYAPCINHGIKKGMGKSQENIKDAVEAGYWHLYRYNPELKKSGKNPFTLDSGEPTASFRDFIMGQIRYSSLAKEFPSVADKLFEMTEEDAREKYETYKKMAEM
ncbi:MAG: thiamine pyrophosphate-dependent enzyme, partial [Firmicutes bacterium]|nr:thiamine pyrophosphate-dependent enzyme [Bacillota bacterium]